MMFVSLFLFITINFGFYTVLLQRDICVDALEIPDLFLPRFNDEKVRKDRPKDFRLENRKSLDISSNVFLRQLQLKGRSRKPSLMELMGQIEELAQLEDRESAIAYDTDTARSYLALAIDGIEQVQSQLEQADDVPSTVYSSLQEGYNSLVTIQQSSGAAEIGIAIIAFASIQLAAMILRSIGCCAGAIEILNYVSVLVAFIILL